MGTACSALPQAEHSLAKSEESKTTASSEKEIRSNQAKYNLDNQNNVINKQTQSEFTTFLAAREESPNKTKAVNALEENTCVTNEQKNLKKDCKMEIAFTGHEDVDKRFNKFPELDKVLVSFQEIKKDLEKRRIKNEPFADEKDANRLWKNLKSKIQKPFSTYKEQSQRKFMGDYLAVIGLIPELSVIYNTIAQEYFEEFSNSLYEVVDSPELLICSCIRDIFWNYTDCSEMFAESLAMKTDMFGHYAHDLEFIAQKEYNELYTHRGSFKQAVSTLHNCGRHKISRDFFNTTYMENVKYDIKAILKPFSQSEIQEIQLLATFARSYMMSPNELKQEFVTDEIFLSHLLEFLSEAVESSNKRYHGFCVEELLDFTAQIAKNADNRKKIGNLKPKKFGMNIFDILRITLSSKNTEEHIAAVNTIWELSFDEANAKIFRDDKHLFDIVKDLRQSNVQELAKASQFACFEIEQDARIPEVIETVLPRENKKFMISYNHKHKARVHKIFDILESIGFQIWIDKNQMVGDMLHRMAEAVWTSDIILVCYSEHYETSKACQTEATYAYKKNKDMFFLKMEREYKPPDGCWLDIIEGNHKFYLMNEKFYMANIKLLLQDLIEKFQAFTLSSSPEKLLRYLDSKIETPKSQKSETSNRPVAPANNEASNAIVISNSTPLSTATPSNALVSITNNIEYSISKTNKLKTWSQLDLEQWIVKNQLNTLPGANHISIQIVQFLMKLYIRAPEAFYKVLKEEMNIHGIEQLMKFSNAIEELVI